MRARTSPGAVMSAIICVGALGVALAGTSPTGNAAIDVAVVLLTAAATIWAASAAPIPSIAGVLAGVALATLHPVVMVASLAASALVVIAWRRIESSWHLALGSLGAAACLNAAGHSRLDEPFAASAAIGIGASVLLAISGIVARPSPHRRRFIIGAVGAAAMGIGAAGLSGLQLSSTGSELSDANVLISRGLSQLRSGDTEGAAASLADASASFAAIDDDLSSPLARVGAVVPGVAQHRSVVAEVSAAAALVTDRLADRADDLSVDALVERGVVDTDALARLDEPLASTSADLDELRAAIADHRSPWLTGRFDDELDELDGELLADRSRVERIRDVAANAPALLGADGPRRYLVAITNPATARPIGGAVEAWVVVTIDAGRGSLEVLDGDTTALTAALAPQGGHSVSPPMLLAASGPTLALTAEQYAGEIDGVVVLDVYSLGRLLKFTGGIDVEESGRELKESNAARYFVADRHLSDDPGPPLAALAAGIGERLFGGSLPQPERLVEIMGPLAADHRLQMWSVDPAEQQFLERIGLAAAPSATTGADVVSVSFDNRLDNALDAYLVASAEFDVVVDRANSTATSTLTIDMTNEVPDGLAEDAVGNDDGLPIGTSRTSVTVLTAYPHVDSSPPEGVTIATSVDDARHVTTFVIELAPGRSSTIALDFAGPIELGDGYRIAVFSPPTASPTPVTAQVADSTGPIAVVRSDGGVTTSEPSS